MQKIPAGSMMEHTGSSHSILDRMRYFLKFKNPGVVHFAITNQCDSRCSTCRFWRHDEPRSVELQDACSAIDMLYESGIRLLSITGGEPLLHPYLVDICNHITKKGMMISYLPTNGQNVTEERSRELARAGVNIVGISVDPLHSVKARRTRNVDPAQIRNAREVMEAQGLRTYAGILLTNHLLPLTGCVEMIKDMGFKRIVFSYPQTDERAPYRASGFHPMLDLDPEYLRAAVMQIKHAKRSFPIYNPDAMLDDLVRSYGGIPQRHPCLGGDRIYYLDWDLQLRKCFADPETFGPVLDMEHLPSGNGTCTSCTQQAFRDMSYVLRAYDRIHSIAEWSSRKDIGGGEGNGTRLLDDFKVLFQLYIGGFV